MGWWVKVKLRAIRTVAAFCASKILDSVMFYCILKAIQAKTVNLLHEQTPSTIHLRPTSPRLPLLIQLSIHPAAKTKPSPPGIRIWTYLYFLPDIKEIY